MKDMENHINAYSFRGVATNFGIPVLFYVYGFWDTLKIIACFLAVWAIWAAILYYLIAKQKELAHIRAWEAEREEDKKFWKKIEDEDRVYWEKKNAEQIPPKTFSQATHLAPRLSSRFYQRIPYGLGLPSKPEPSPPEKDS